MSRVTILIGDALERLRGLPDESVHACVTSPPYWGLRDYGEPGQIGNESTPEEYVARLVAVFRETRRVLRSDGTLWLNLGDSYAGSWGGQGRQRKAGALAGRNACAQRQIAAAAKRRSGTGRVLAGQGLKAKDLVGVPWMVAFALRSDGWWLRSDCVWAKPSPMPESVTDRPSRAHEYVFMLTKSRRYFFDMDAVREPFARGAENASPGGKAERVRGVGGRADGYVRGTHGGWTPTADGRSLRTVWTIASTPSGIETHTATMPPALAERCIKASTQGGGDRA
jgi:DNA modification methylase